MKPATRNGLTALILILLSINVGAVVARHGRSDRTSVSVAPAVTTTESPTTAAPTTETTVTVTTVSPTTSGSTTSVPTNPATGNSAVPGPTDAGVTTTSTGSATTSIPDTTTVPTADPATVQAAPPALPEHPHTGRRSLLVPALMLIGVGLAGLRITRRTRPNPTA